MRKGRLFHAQALALIVLALSINGCGKPSNEKLVEIIKESPQKGILIVTSQYKITSFDTVDIISVHPYDTDLTSVMPSDTLGMVDPAETQKMFQAVDKNTLFVRATVTAKVVPIVTLPAPFSVRPISPELSLQEPTAIWLVVRKEDKEWVCTTVLGVEGAKEE